MNFSFWPFFWFGLLGQLLIYVRAIYRIQVVIRAQPRVGVKRFLVFSGEGLRFGCGFFAYSWKLPACSGAFLLTLRSFDFT